MPDPSFSESTDEGEIRFLVSRNAGDVFSAALRFAGTEARTLVPVVLAIVGPLVLAAAALRVIGGTDGGALLASVADLGVSVLLTSALFAYVQLYRAGALGEAQVGDVWEETKALLGPVAVGTGAMLLALFALAIPVVLVVATLIAVAPVVGAVVGVAVLLVVLLLVTPLLALAIVAVGLEGLGPAEAFRCASALAHGERGLVLGTMALLTVSMVLVLTFVIGGLAASLGVDRLAEPGAGGALATALVSVATLPVSVVFTLTWVVLYGSLVARAEGGPLGDEVDAIARLGDERPGDTLARLLDTPDDRFRGGGFEDDGDPEARP